MSPRQMMTSLLALLLAVGTHSEDTSAEGPLGSAGCEYDGMLYAAGQAITVGGCESWRCVNSNWKVSGKLNPNKMAPCPPGAFPYRQSCLTEEPLWRTRGEAAGICQIKGGRLLELYGEDEPHTEAARRQLAAALNPGGGYWVTAAEPASDGLCAAVPPGAIDKEVVQLRCDMRLRPVCVIPRGPCDQGVCTVNEHTYDNNTVIETIDQCTSIVCLNSYPMTVTDEACCEVEESHGVTSLYTSGSHIKTIDQCTSIVCLNGNPTNVTDDTCCEVEESNGVTRLYTSGSHIKTIDQCTTIVCLNSSPTNVIDGTCCEFEESHGVTRLYTSGSHIKTIDQCTTIVCRDSSPTNVIDDTCCEFEDSAGLTSVYTAGSHIKTIDQCISIVCLNGNPTNVTDETCCAFEDSDGVARLYTSGSDIKTCIDQCTSIVCRDSKPTHVADYTCDSTVRECLPGFSLCACRCWYAEANRYTYDDAEQYCTDKGAILATPRSEKENTCAADVATRANFYGGINYFWIGYRGGKTVESFVGADGKGGMTYANWWTANYGSYPKLADADNCVSLYYGDGTWVDGTESDHGPCHDRLSVLCQMQY